MYLLLFIQQLIASGTHIVSKDLTGTLDPMLILFYRAAIASLFFTLWFLVFKSKRLQLEKRDLWGLLLLGVLNIPLNQLLFFISIEMTTAPNVALAYSLSPAFVSIIAKLFLNEKFNFIKVSGIVLALLGALFLLAEKGIDFNSEHFLGNLLALVASFSWAIYTVVGKKYSTKYGASYTTGISTIVGFIIFIPIFFILGNSVDTSEIQTIDWVKILYLGIITSVLGYALWYYALKKMEASKVSVFNNLQPVLTTIFAYFLFSQELTLQFFVAGILIITGVLMTQKANSGTMLLSK